MSQDKDVDEVEDKTERTDNGTVKNDKNTTNPPGCKIKVEKPTAAKQKTKHLPQEKPKPLSDTNFFFRLRISVVFFYDPESSRQIRRGDEYIHH